MRLDVGGEGETVISITLDLKNNRNNENQNLESNIYEHRHDKQLPQSE